MTNWHNVPFDEDDATALPVQANILVVPSAHSNQLVLSIHSIEIVEVAERGLTGMAGVRGPRGLTGLTGPEAVPVPIADIIPHLGNAVDKVIGNSFDLVTVYQLSI